MSDAPHTPISSREKDKPSIAGLLGTGVILMSVFVPWVRHSQALDKQDGGLFSQRSASAQVAPDASSKAHAPFNLER